MTTREKILVGLMCLAILYGAYELLWTPATRKAPSQPTADSGEALQKFAGEVSQKLVKEKPTEDAHYRMQKAAARWTKDPFLQSSVPLKEKKPADASARATAEPSGPQPDFVYTGFLQLGDKKMAVINGMEYAVGESLGVNDYYVKQITGQSVTIGRLKGLESIQLPLFESNAGL